MARAVAKSKGKHRENTSSVFDSLDFFYICHLMVHKKGSDYGINNCMSCLFDKLGQIINCNC